MRAERANLLNLGAAILGSGGGYGPGLPRDGADEGKEEVGVERLDQKPRAPVPLGEIADRLLPESGRDDDREIRSGSPQMTLQVDTGHPTELHVEDQAERSRGGRRLDEGLGRVEQRGLESTGLEQPAQR